jgi:transcriptional regulator with XRE-family HTH domain
MTQPQLAAAAGLGLSTVVDFERTRRTVSPDAVNAIRSALEATGVEFTNGGQPGVRLRKDRVTTWENGKLVSRGLDDDPMVNALVEKHSRRLIPEVLREPEAPDPWLEAVERMYEFEDVKPLAALVHSSEPMPHWVRNQLAHLLDNSARYSVGEDRLAFFRTDRMRGKIDSQKTNFRIGQAVLEEMDAGKSYTAAVKAVMEKEGRNQTEGRSVKQAVANVKKLPPSLRPGARKR